MFIVIRGGKLLCSRYFGYSWENKNAYIIRGKRTKGLGERVIKKGKAKAIG